MSLFKFKSAKTIDDLTRDIQTMKDDQIWFSGVKDLNDPFEKIYSTKTLDEFNGTEQVVTDFFEPFRKNVDDYFDKVGILSLCEKNVNLVMSCPEIAIHKNRVYAIKRREIFSSRE